MADPQVSIDGERLSVQPGGQARATVTVRNLGTLVEGYRLDVVGEGVAGWAEVVPPEVNVYPGEEATAAVVVSPPAGGAAPSGVWPYGVRARSLVDPDGSAVAEGEVEVGKVFGLQAKLVPVTSTGRWRGRHVVQLSNWGNTSVRLRLVGSNPDESLGFLVRPPTVELPIGSSASARLWVRSRRPFLRGHPVRLPFTVVGEPEGAPVTAGPAPGPAPVGATPDRPVVDGALNQRPVLTRATVTGAVLALALVVGGIAFGVTRSPAAAGLGFTDEVPPAQVTGVRAVATGPDTVNLTWQGVPRVTGYEITTSRGLGDVFQTGKADAAQTSTTVTGLPVQSDLCFRLRALGPTLQGPLSEPACATTLAAPASPAPGPTGALASTPPPGGAASSGADSVPPVVDPGQSVPPGGGPPSPGPVSSGPVPPSPVPPSPVPPSPGGSTPPPLAGRWVAAAEYWLQGRVDEPQSVPKLRQAGLSPQVADSRSHPRLPPPPVGPASPVLIVYLGPYDTQAAAQQACDTQVQPVTGFCRAIQLDPG